VAGYVGSVEYLRKLEFEILEPKNIKAWNEEVQTHMDDPNVGRYAGKWKYVEEEGLPVR